MLRKSRATCLAGTFLLLANGCEGDPTGIDHRLEISAASDFLDIGQSVQLSAAVRDASGRKRPVARLSWSSSNPTIAAVNGGIVTGRAVGEVFIKARVGGASDSVRLVIERPLASLQVWPSDTLYLIRGRKAGFRIEMKDGAGRPVAHSVSLTSSAPSVAAVEGMGVTTSSLGQAVIRIRAGLKSVEVPVHVVTGARYTVRELEPLQEGSALNNLGWVVGRTEVGQYFLWRGGKVSSLGDLSGSGLPHNIVGAVNDSGAVLGLSYGWLRSPMQGWVWRDGIQTPITTGMTISAPGGINNRGQVVGFATSRWPYYGPHGRAFLWHGGELKWIDPPGSATSRAVAVNDRGDVVVRASFLTDPVRVLHAEKAYLWRNGEFTELPQHPFDPHGQPRPSTSPFLLDNHGRVAMGAHWEDHTDGVLFWDGSRVTNFGAVGYLADMNNYADIITNAGTNRSHLIRGGEVLRLEEMLTSADWQIDPEAINDLGQILARGRHLPTGREGPILLVPGS